MKLRTLTLSIIASTLSLSAHAFMDQIDFMDIKDSGSRASFTNYDTFNKISKGGGGSDSERLISPEFRALSSGHLLTQQEVPAIVEASFFDKGWTNAHGIEGVTVEGLTKTSLTLGFTGGSDSVDTLTFYGSSVTDMLELIAVGNINLKDKKSRLAIFEADTEKSNIWIGGGKSDARKVSDEFAELTGGSKIQGKEVEGILKALVHGKRNASTEKVTLGIENVELLGVDRESFAINVKESSLRSERIIFTGEMVRQAVESLALDRVDTGDGWSKLAVWDLTSGHNLWVSGTNNVAGLTAVFGTNNKNHLKAEDYPQFRDALFSRNGIEGVKVLNVGVEQATGLNTITVQLASAQGNTDTVIIVGAY